MRDDRCVWLRAYLLGLGIKKVKVHWDPATWARPLMIVAPAPSEIDANDLGNFIIGDFLLGQHQKNSLAAWSGFFEKFGASAVKKVDSSVTRWMHYEHPIFYWQIRARTLCAALAVQSTPKTLRELTRKAKDEKEFEMLAQLYRAGVEKDSA